MSSAPSLVNLYNFVANSNEEKQLIDSVWNKTTLQYYIDESNKTYGQGKFYLGGQYKMPITDSITLELIERVKQINKQRMIDCPPLHSYEIASVKWHEERFTNIENMVKCYLEIMKKRNNITA